MFITVVKTSSISCTVRDFTDHETSEEPIEYLDNSQLTCVPWTLNLSESNRFILYDRQSPTILS